MSILTFFFFQISRTYSTSNCKRAFASLLCVSADEFLSGAGTFQLSARLSKKCQFFIWRLQIWISIFCVIRFISQIRQIKEKEFAERDLSEETENSETPQIYVNELFRLYKKNHFDMQALDDHIFTMLVGVSIRIMLVFLKHLFDQWRPV